MKQLTCEICGSTDLIKEDGVFVCQSCGTKYSIEEAKKMMIEGTVDVTGSTVKVDNTSELSNLYQLARRAKSENNDANAARYYEMILLKDPNSWEATFYSVYYQARCCKVGEINSAATSIIGCLSSTFSLIKENTMDEGQKKSAINEIFNQTFQISDLLYKSEEAYWKKINGSLLDKSYTDTLHKARYGITHTACHEFTKAFSDSPIFETGIPYLKRYYSYIRYDKEILAAIRKFEPNYAPPELRTSSGGCYVATAVYGSYDCPQVWTLRRFRDYALAETWYGRTFIRTYYVISPTLVKWFGHTSWFKKMWKGKLDQMVANLNAGGVEDTPYEDKVW